MTKPIESLTGDDLNAFREALRPTLKWILNDEGFKSADHIDEIVTAAEAGLDAKIAAAEDWAEGTLPGGLGTKSAKEWAAYSAAISDRVFNSIPFTNWAALAAATGMLAGDRARVSASDTGTHTDPVVGGTVANAGDYVYSTAPAGWQRTGDLDSQTANHYANDATDTDIPGGAPGSRGAAFLLAQTRAAIAGSLGRVFNWVGSATRVAFWVDVTGNELLGADTAPADNVSYYRGHFVDWLRSLPFTVAQMASFSSLYRVQAYKASTTRAPIAIDSVGNLLLGANASPADGISFAEGFLVDNILARATGNSVSGTTAIPLSAANKITLNTSTTWYGYYSGGQSLSLGRRGIPPISTAQPYNNKMLTGGVKGTGAGLVALVEDTNQEGGVASTTTGETVCSGAVNNAVKFYTQATGKDPNGIIFIAGAPGQGATSIAGLSKGTTSYNRMLAQVTNAKTAATAAGQSYVVAAVSWIQGEEDGTRGTTRAAYLSSCLQLVADFNADIRAITGQTSPVHMLMCQCTRGTRTNPNVALAQFDAVNSSDLIHFVTSYGFIPFDADNLHSTPVGYRWLGTYIGRALKQLLVDGNVPDCIWPLSATATIGATTIKIKYRTPTKLVLNGPVQTNYGFKVADDIGTLTLSNIRVVNAAEVWIDVDRLLGPNPYVNYALDYQAASVPVNGGAGDLTDSTAETTTILGTSYSLVHRAPAMRLPIYYLEA